jgi:hypothetical protein
MNGLAHGFSCVRHFSRLYTVLTNRDDELRREEEPVLPLIPQLHGCKRDVITFNVPVVYMAQDFVILMRENPFLGPLEGLGPKKSRFSGTGTARLHYRVTNHNCRVFTRAHAVQTTYNQESLAFCFQLCTVAHFVGFLLLPWFSSSLVFFPYS